jgi:hypothetical protein
MSSQALVFEVHFFGETTSERTITIYAFDADGVGQMVDARDVGPFETSLEVSQWVWRTMSRHLGMAMR